MLKIEEKPILKIPEIIFYENKNNEYKMLNLKKNTSIGYLMVSPRKDELFINSLVIEAPYRRQGFGKKLLDFAKRVSIGMGFNGRMRCVAGLTPFDTKNPSHIFFRKYGFTGDDKKLIKKIDNAIKESKQLNPKSTTLAYMYFTNT